MRVQMPLLLFAGKCETPSQFTRTCFATPAGSNSSDSLTVGVETYGHGPARSVPPCGDHLPASQGASWHVKNFMGFDSSYEPPQAARAFARHHDGESGGTRRMRRRPPQDSGANLSC
jgi:hypothetical protein